MNKRIKELAEQAGYKTDMFGIGHWDMPECKKFAALVAEQEREACAKIADRQNGDDEEDSESCVWSKAARHIAAAIRERGSK
jgi:hypothetical protein